MESSNVSKSHFHDFSIINQFIIYTYLFQTVGRYWYLIIQDFSSYEENKKEKYISRLQKVGSNLISSLCNDG